MTAHERWQSWTQAESPPSASTIREAFPEFVRDFLGAQESGGPLKALREVPSKELFRILDGIWSGGLIAVGLRPQLEILLLASLWHVARGHRVLVFSGMPAAPSFSRDLRRALAEGLGINVEMTGHLFGRPNATFKSVLDADIVLCDYVQILDALKKNGESFADRPTAALACEMDMCLYDARLGIFDRGTLRALGCIYRSTGREPWKDHRNTLDFADAGDAFETVGGVTSYLSKEIAGELRTCYGDMFQGGVQALEGRTFPAYAFRRAQTKIEWLCRDINLAQGDCLVFYSDDRLRQTLAKELSERGQATTTLDAPRDLDTFLLMAGDKKRVGLFPGLPSLLRPPADSRPPVTVFLAQHYLLAHQHQKLRAFLDMAVSLPSRPMLYFSLEDDLFSIYADEDSFQGAFDLIAYTEKYDKRRRVRRVMAGAILRKIRRIRRRCLDEDYPILTAVSQARVRKATGGRESRRKAGRIRRQLEAQCFCGSGKPFRECHGKAAP